MVFSGVGNLFITESIIKGHFFTSLTGDGTAISYTRWSRHLQSKATFSFPAIH